MKRALLFDLDETQMSRSPEGSNNHESVCLQVPHPSADLLIGRVAGSIPKPARRLVFEGDQRGHPTGSAPPKVVLSRSRQRKANALPTMPIVDREPIHVSSPSVPARDQGPEDLPITLGHQQGSGGVVNQALDMVETVSRACMLASSLLPQVEYHWHIAPLA